MVMDPRDETRFRVKSIEKYTECSESTEFVNWIINCCPDDNKLLSLAEDILDIFGEDSADTIFSILEARKDSIKLELSTIRGKGIVFLRTVNELIRRTSKVETLETLGRICVLVSQLLGVCERSGVNLKGECGKADSLDIVYGFPEKTREILSDLLLKINTIETDAHILSNVIFYLLEFVVFF